jgi:hypothetical protein
MSAGVRGSRRDDRAADWLRQPTPTPSDPGRFTPDLYPAGPPLEPAREASAAIVGEVELRTFLEVHLGGNRARIESTLDRFHDPRVIERLPDAGVRAGFLTLTGTLGDLVIEPFLAGELAVTGFCYGAPADPSRVVGPPARPDEASDGQRDIPTSWRVVNQRYRFEPFPLLAGSLLHDLLHHEPAVSDDEETIVHALLAAVHLQILARSPQLAGPTELARRQSSLALSLLCSRHPDQAEVRIIAPDGLGTIPGGARLMQTPDFWSIPFAPDLTDPQPPTAALRLVLDALVGPMPEVDHPVVVDERVAELLDERVLGRELRPHELVAAAAALGLAGTPDLQTS